MKVRLPNNSNKFLAELITHGLESVYSDKVRLMETNHTLRGLNYKILQSTKKLNPPTYSFKLNRQWRVLGYQVEGEFQPTKISKHYEEL